jgi:hypothetical protein
VRQLEESANEWTKKAAMNVRDLSELTINVACISVTVSNSYRYILY